MGLPTTRVSHIAAGIGPKIPIAIVLELVKKKATHVTFHSNKINSLEIVVRHRGKSTEAEAIISKENCAEHVVELDLSSNNLHEGCELSQFRCPTRFSLLSMTANLVKLNVASNNLNTKSLCALICIKNSDGTCIPLLPCLRHLDVSHNNISTLPDDLDELFPALTHFVGMNNRLKSLTKLLQTLHKLRGRLQSIHLLNGKSSNSNNPVCMKRLYREKMVFILGSNLKQLDGVRITRNERDSVRLHLARDYEIEMSNSNYPQPHQQQQLHHPIKDVNAQCNSNYSPQSSDESFEAFSEAPHFQKVRCKNHDDIENNKDKHISDLEVKVASLSALVEQQTHLTTNLLKAAKDPTETNELETRNTSIVHLNKSKTEIPRNDKATCTQQSIDDNVLKDQKLAVATGVLRLFFVEYKRRRANVYLAFSHWRFVMNILRKAKRMLIESEEKWQKKTSALIKEAKKSSDKLSCSLKAEQVAHRKAVDLTSVVREFEKKLQDEQERHKDSTKNSSNTIDELKGTVMRLNTILAGKSEELSKITQQYKADVEASGKELEKAKEELKIEKSKSASLKTEKMLTINQSEETITSCMEKLEDLKLQIVQKDAVIKQLKNSFEQLATTAANDRSKAEQSSLSERQSTELLQKHHRKLSEMEAEVERLQFANEHLESTLAGHQKRSSMLQRDIDMHLSTIADLRSEVDKLKSNINDRDSTIESLHHKIKVALEESEDANKCAKESRKAKIRLEGRCDRLQSQLDHARDEIHASKESTVKKELLESEMNKTTELKLALDNLRREYQERESELLSSIKQIHSENTMIRESSFSQEKHARAWEKKLKRAQSEWKQKESQLINSHSLEMKEAKQVLSQEAASLKNDLESERLLRLEVERKIGILEQKEIAQKYKMQNAIQGLTKQLSTLT